MFQTGKWYHQLIARLSHQFSSRSSLRSLLQIHRWWPGQSISKIRLGWAITITRSVWHQILISRTLFRRAESIEATRGINKSRGLLSLRRYRAPVTLRLSRGLAQLPMTRLIKAENLRCKNLKQVILKSQVWQIKANKNGKMRLLTRTMSTRILKSTSWPIRSPGRPKASRNKSIRLFRRGISKMLKILARKKTQKHI